MPTYLREAILVRVGWMEKRDGKIDHELFARGFASRQDHMTMRVRLAHGEQMMNACGHAETDARRRKRLYHEDPSRIGHRRSTSDTASGRGVPRREWLNDAPRFRALVASGYLSPDVAHAIIQEDATSAADQRKGHRPGRERRTLPRDAR
jgi:hypothetical protein